MRRRWIVFAKAPVAGSVKTRLVPPLTPEQAVRVHAAALRDTVARAERAVADAELEVWVGGTGADAVERIAALVPGRAVRRQGVGDLGARLAGALAVAFEAGCDRVAVIGSDHPTLPAAHLAAILDALDDADAVLGPSDDGGYYAVAVRRAGWPRARALLDGIPWSSPDVLTITRQRARHAALSLAESPVWYDVDDAGDLERAFRDAEPGSALARLRDEPDFAAWRPVRAR